jgi:hypothetical protein
MADDSSVLSSNSGVTAETNQESKLSSLDDDCFGDDRVQVCVRVRPMLPHEGERRELYVGMHFS